MIICKCGTVMVLQETRNGTEVYVCPNCGDLMEVVVVE